MNTTDQEIDRQSLRWRISEGLNDEETIKEENMEKKGKRRKKEKKRKVKKEKASELRRKGQTQTGRKTR